MQIPLQLLGQSGCRFDIHGTIIYVDPYLSDSVRELDAPDLERLIPVPLKPENVTDANWVLITHEHIDHCDPHTLPILSQASPGCRFIGPPVVVEQLASWGIDESRIQIAVEEWIRLDDNLSVHAVPAEHPVIERDDEGNSRYVGYIVKSSSKSIYVAGDTSMTRLLLDFLMTHKPIDVALLPVNEHNYFRRRRGIIGNMSVREAFLLAEELGIKKVIPVHWDMFAVNSVDPDEIRAVYNQTSPAFELLLGSYSYNI